MKKGSISGKLKVAASGLAAFLSSVILWIVLFFVGGASSIVIGVYVLFGTGACLLAAGVAMLLFAFLLKRAITNV